MPLDTYRALYEALLLPMALGLPRTLAMLMIFPLLPASVFPGLIRNGLAIGLLLVCQPMAAQQIDAAPASALAWTGLIAKELLIGGAIGWAFALMIWALENVGALIDIQTGSNNGAIFDPINNQSGGPWAPLMRNLGLVLFLCHGGLLVMISCLYRSFAEWPVTSYYPPGLAQASSWSQAQLAHLLARTAMLAAPVIGVLLVVELGIGLINRAVPQLNVFSFAQPIKGAVAVLAMIVTLPQQFSIAKLHFSHDDGAWQLLQALVAPASK